MRRVAPIWLSAPSRWAALSPSAARWVLMAAALLMVASWLALIEPPQRASAVTANGQHDIVLYQAIVDGIRHGGSYYPVTAEALRAGGYPLKPFVTFRLPTLARVLAALPRRLSVGLLWSAAAAVFATWYWRLSPALARPAPRIAVLVMLAGGTIAFVQPALLYFHEVWAGLLIALSLGVWSRGNWLAAVAIGLAAALIRETSALYLGVMFLVAAGERDWRETAGWTAATTILAFAVAAHAHAVAQVVHVTDPASPGWAGMLGFGFFVRAEVTGTALSAAPLAVAAPLVALALIGWASWRDPLAVRVLATITAYGALLSLFGRADGFYWGLLVAPLLLVGLVFAPDGLRDLVTAARDTRRITVTRMVR